MSKNDNAIENIKTIVENIPPELRDALLQEMQTHMGTMETPRIVAYKKTREANLVLNEELTDLITDEEYTETAQILDSIEEGDFVYHQEIEIDYRLDFLLFDFRAHDGKTLVQRKLEQTDITNASKHETLTVYNAAKTSLYSVVAANRLECTVTLRNLLNKAEPLVTITDMGLSRTLKPHHHMLFARIMRYPEFNANSGIAMVFTQRKYDKVYKAFEKRYKKLPSNLSLAEKRFIAFFHINREFGEPIKTQ